MAEHTKMIVGLGNPGKKYEKTRHNIGFMVLDNLAQTLSVDFKRKLLLNAEVAEAKHCILVKPKTFMNASGDAVAKLTKKYAVKNENILVICDDLNLDFSKMRMRLKGSAGGHNGLKSIIQRLGSQDFRRLKYGIGRPPNKEDVMRFVLQKFTKTEFDQVDLDIDKMVSFCEKWKENADEELLMNDLNTKK